MTQGRGMTGRRSFLDDVPGLIALARRQRGVTRREQLAALGVTHDDIRAQVRAKRWQTLGPQVVVLSTGSLTRQQQMYAGCAHVGPLGHLAGFTTLELRGLRGWDRSDVHVVVPHGFLQSRLPGVVVHQSRHLDAVDLVAGSSPPTVTAARAAIDAAGWLPSARSASGLVRAVVQQGVADPGDMLDVLDRIWRVRHTATIRDTLVEALAGADSQAEVDVLRILRAVGFRDVRRQVRIETPIGHMRVDLAVRLRDGRTLAIEVDGPSHDDPRQRARDAERDAALIALGYVVLHIPVALLRADESAVRAQLWTIWMANVAA